MDGQIEAEKSTAVADKGPRQRSTIAFPYMDLKSACEMAEAIFSHVAGGECDDDQLAAWTNQSCKSSTFRVQVYAARTYGILDGEAGRHRLTELGKALVDPQQAREAKVRAFLSVPLYLAIFEKFKGGVLPPTAALEREIESLGVAPKQRDRARQVFERSAEQSGFFEHGKNRLVQPGIVAGKMPPKLADSVTSQSSGAGSAGGGAASGGGDSGNGGGGTTGDLLLDALISKLPPAGSEWGVDERVTWLSLMSMGFQMSYGIQPTIEVKKLVS